MYRNYILVIVLMYKANYQTLILLLSHIYIKEWQIRKYKEHSIILLKKNHFIEDP